MGLCRICGKYTEDYNAEFINYCSLKCVVESQEFIDIRRTLINLTEQLDEKNREKLTFLLASDQDLVFEAYVQMGGKFGLEAWGLW